MVAMIFEVEVLLMLLILSKLRIYYYVLEMRAGDAARMLSELRIGAGSVHILAHFSTTRRDATPTRCHTLLCRELLHLSHTYPYTIATTSSFASSPYIRRALRRFSLLMLWLYTRDQIKLDQIR